MEDIFNKLTDYVAVAHLWHYLDKTHSSEETNYLMVRLVQIEEDVSSHYGLPLTFNFSEIFQELGIKEDFKLSDISGCIEKLELAAKEYFNRPVLSDLELLKIAQESQIDIDYVLPELTLKLLAEPYYSFCYFFLFLPKKTTPDLFLEELKIAVKNDCTIMLTKIVQKRLANNEEDNDYILLKAMGLRYIDIFLEYYYTFDDNRLEYLANGCLFNN